MIDYTTTRVVMEKYIDDNFNTCPIKFENVPLKTEGLPSWAALFDRPSVSEPVEFGEDVPYMSGGVLIIQIFTPLDSGTAVSRALAQELADLMGQKEIEGLVFQEPELHPVAPPKDATWYQCNLVIPYQTVMGQNAGIC